MSDPITSGKIPHMTQSGGPSNNVDPARKRGRVMIHGLSPIRKPGAGISDSDGSSSEMLQSSSTAATAILPFRIGHGYDIHRLQKGQPGGKLVLAGVTVSEELSPIAHSDGDVIYHAVVDAMLGALGFGDIGELFGDSDPRWKDASSRIFVDDVYERARKMGYRLANVDVSLLLERPKILPFKPAMIENLRLLFGTNAAVNIKAGTNEQCDSVGRGEAVAAHAVVLLAAAN